MNEGSSHHRWWGPSKPPAEVAQRALEVLCNSALFSRVPLGVLKQVVDAAHVQPFPRDASLLAQGNVLDGLIAVLSGHVKEEHLTIEGREIVLAIRGPGDVVGQLASLEGEPALASAIALEPVEALIVPGPRLRSLLGRAPGLSSALLSTLVLRLNTAYLERIELVTCSSTVRMSRRIVELAERWGRPSESSVEVAVSVSQADLAARAGLSREAAVRALQELRTLGLIRTSRRRIQILDIEGLRDQAFQ